MARGGGTVRPGGIYHVISRFVAKEWFMDSDRERKAYRALLEEAFDGTDWRCFAYALMSSHIHLALVAGFAPLASWLRRMHTVFAQGSTDDTTGSVASS